MNNSTKEQIGCDAICKSHSARTERDLYRICPSKLSKRELEDLYFALLENNIELKKNINIYQDKIKVLSTKLQRMTVQKNVAGKEKDCCASKAVVSEQKESITDLKKTNERMADRIRILNMRLCSAKQFLKRSPSQSNNCKTCTRCSFKNSSMSALNPVKKSDSSMKTTAVSCQFLEKDVSEKATGTVETEPNSNTPEKGVREELCSENKCKTTMDELKEKINNLQEELLTSHNDYSSRIAKLEGIVSELHDENLRVRSDHVASAHALEQTGNKADQLKDQLRTADAKCNELNMELSIEKRKVAELETGLKLANLSNHVIQTIDQLAATKENNDLDAISRESSRSKIEEVASSSKNLELPASCKKTNAKNSKSDDSGYTELNKSCETDDDQVMVKMNRELVKKIAELQTQLDLLKIAAAGEHVGVDLPCQHMKKPKDFESYDNETHDVNEPNIIMKTMIDLNSMLLRDSPPDGVTEKKYWNEPELSSIQPNSSLSVPEGKPTKTKPWEDLLVKQRSVEDNVQNDIEQSPNTAKVKFATKAPRSDDHNRYQIPGPLPAVYPSQNTKDRRKSLRNSQISKKSLEKLKKKASTEEKAVKIDNNVTDNASIDKDNESYLNAFERDSEDERKDLDDDRKDSQDDIKDSQDDRRDSEESLLDAQARLANRTPTRDSIFVTKKKFNHDEALAEVKKPSDSTFLMDSVCTPPIVDRPVVDLMKETSTQVEENPDFGTQMDPPNPQRRDSATYTADVPNTYTVHVDQHSRATSPLNTEQEISSLSDLPSEKDGKPRIPSSPENSPRATLSPGEERGTMTYTDMGTDTHTDYGSLSDGEMPNTKAPLSVGEWPCDITPPVARSSERMEATLRSISEELARCRRLLITQRTKENDQGTQCEPKPPTKEELGIELRHSTANRHLVDSNSISCLFILHIGTLVLSDESVLYCRDKTLVLTWKFYTQNAAMTRVQSGRVVQFDFVTEYDVAFNDDFLEYMKHSEMAIVLCEMNKQDEPFAMCSLPLREALLHANRRADMSLALIPAGTGSIRDSIGDEIGVLDLWCTLRVDVSLMSTIHRAMHTSSPSKMYGNPMRLTDHESKIIQQAVDDEISSERLSRDIDLTISKRRNSPGKQMTSPELFAEKFNPKGSDTDLQNSIDGNSSRYDDDVEGYQGLRPYRRRSTQTQKSTPASDLGHSRGLVGFQHRWPNEQLRQDSSGIIINEVPATIQSFEDMKLALERNVQHELPKLPKMDDESAHLHSSIGSVKSSAVRHQLSKLRLTKHKQPTRNRVDSLEELLKKKPSSLEESTSIPIPLSERSVSHPGSVRERPRMISMSKYVASPEMSKLIETSKKCVKYNDVLSCDEPQKESSAESDEASLQSIDITILWLALNEECEAMVNSSIQKLYVAYSFLGRRGADLETPFSLPKPKHYADKCYFNFKKTFHLHECDLPLLGHMSRCRAGGGASTDPRDCIVFTLVSEPAEDPLGLSNCEDIGYAYLYLGDVLAYSGDSAGYTEVVGVRAVRGGVCGVLAVRVDQLPVLRRALAVQHAAEPH